MAFQAATAAATVKVEVSTHGPRTLLSLTRSTTQATVKPKNGAETATAAPLHRLVDGRDLLDADISADSTQPSYRKEHS